jgi:signal transduction histidine kinase
MQQLIDDLLTFTKIVGTPGSFTVVNLDSLLAEIRAQFQETVDQLGAEISVSYLPTVRGIAFQLRQLFVNLLSNAIKFRAKDRPLQVTISSSRVRVPEMADVYGSERFYRIEVRDNGIGFPPHQAERIFNLFEQLHGRDQYSGTGIGLAICRRIMDNNHGVIRAHGQPGEGALFEIFFRSE